jgi:hypothetical protein
MRLIGKLGKRAPRLDGRTLRLAMYLPCLPPAPASIDWSGKVTDWTQLLNDSLGDCTIAAAGHLITTWTAANGVQHTPLDLDILTAYEQACGYNPSDPNSDQGGVELDVLKYWQQTGIGLDKIGPYLALNPKNENHVRSAVQLFGGAYIGLSLPVSCQDQDVWDVVSGPQGESGSWGGHAVCVVGYNEVGPVCVTWGATKQMTWAFWLAYCDEAYAILSPDWDVNGVAPSGFDGEALRVDLAALAA